MRSYTVLIYAKWKKWLDKEILLFEKQAKKSDSSNVSLFYRLPEKILQEASSDL
jgi:hypothetical protein